MTIGRSVFRIIIKNILYVSCYFNIDGKKRFPILKIGSINPIIIGLFSFCLASKTAFMQLYVEMMGLIGMGNNPMVGASVAVAVAVEEAMK